MFFTSFCRITVCECKRVSSVAEFTRCLQHIFPAVLPLQVGLDKIISTQEQVGGLQEQLTAMEPVLIKTQAEVEVMIVTIMQDKEEAGKTQSEARTIHFLLVVINTSQRQ